VLATSPSESASLSKFAARTHALIALFLVAPFREQALVTISGLIGDRYGRGARAVAGAITAFAFPMWSVATALAFASAVHVATGIPMVWSLVRQRQRQWGCDSIVVALLAIGSPVPAGPLSTFAKLINCNGSPARPSAGSDVPVT
jgi:hypothetical protein